MLGLVQIRKLKNQLILLVCAIVTIFVFFWCYLSIEWLTIPGWINWKPDVPLASDKAAITPSAHITTATPISGSAATSAIPSKNAYTQTLVIAKLKEDDALWADQLAQELPHLTSAIYTIDDSNASLTVPMNKGHEVMVYLTYIIDHYSKLSDVTLFMHSHQYAWHNNDFLDSDSALMVKRLKSEHVIRNGYMNLRCHHEPRCPDHIHPTAPIEEHDIISIPESAVIGVSWKQLFPNATVPEILSQPCCAQFSVSAERIRNVSLDDYVSYRDWLLDTALEDGVSGRVWEYVWQWLFTGQPVFCPDEISCYCEGYGVCFGRDDYNDYLQFREEVWDLETKIDKLKESANDTLDIPQERISSMEVDVQYLLQKMGEIKAKAV